MSFGASCGTESSGKERSCCIVWGELSQLSRKIELSPQWGQGGTCLDGKKFFGASQPPPNESEEMSTAIQQKQKHQGQRLLKNEVWATSTPESRITVRNGRRCKHHNRGLQLQGRLGTQGLLPLSMLPSLCEICVYL